VIAIVVLLLGIFFVWVGGTNKGAQMWQAITGQGFKPLGFQ